MATTTVMVVMMYGNNNEDDDAIDNNYNNVKVRTISNDNDHDITTVIIQ